jgi:hypothetical protein
MQVAPASTSSILINITGVTQDPTTYSIVGTTLTFSAAPPTGTNNISVRYLGIPASGVTTTAYRTVTNFTATAGQTSFSVPSYTVGYIDVFRNGVRLVNNGADFVATTGTTVVLNNACTVGDSVVTESFYVSSVLNAIPATAGAVNSTYITDAAVTQAKLAANVAGNGPAFSAVMTADQSVTGNVDTKVAFSTEVFDTNNNYDPATNYRFTPTVAGYYQINLALISNQNTLSQLKIVRNGTTASAAYTQATNTAGLFTAALLYMNGSTDYIEAYAIQTSTGSFRDLDAYSYFQASMVRSS